MGGIAPYGTYATRDEKAVALAALEPKFWMAFCAAVGLDASLEALAPGPHQAEWKRRVAEIIATKTRDEWAAFGAEHDCCIEPILDPDEVADDPQVKARGLFVELEGGLRVPRTPLATRPALGRAPAQGADGRDVLRDAGFSADEIATLTAAGATR
jgi:crotonobetainyl-CoA:carnitine CoA-transferase CaiB-like acyl-CoA transferase